MRVRDSLQDRVSYPHCLVVPDRSWVGPTPGLGSSGSTPPKRQWQVSVIKFLCGGKLRGKRDEVINGEVRDFRKGKQKPVKVCDVRTLTNRSQVEETTLGPERSPADEGLGAVTVLSSGECRDYSRGPSRAWSDCGVVAGRGRCPLRVDKDP